METAGQLHELAWVKGACRPALLWLAQFDPGRTDQRRL